SIEDRWHNTLTFSPTGIASSAGGLSVPFTRDGQGRITLIQTPIFDPNPLGGHRYSYTYAYDGAGNLVTFTLPDSAQPSHTYDGAHRLLSTKDARGNAARTSTYDTAGRLATDTDAMGNVTSYVYDLTLHRTTITNPDTGIVVQTFDTRGLLL